MKLKSLSVLLAVVFLAACERDYIVDDATYTDVYVTNISGQYMTIQEVDDSSRSTHTLWMGKFCYRLFEQLRIGEVIRYPIEHRVYSKRHDEDKYYFQDGRHACNYIRLYN